MMMVPRSYGHGPRAERRQSDASLVEKEPLPARRSIDLSSRQSTVSALSQSFTGNTSPSNNQHSSHPVKIPPRSQTRNNIQPQRPAPSALQIPPPCPNVTKSTRRDSVKDILSSTAIPARRKPRPRAAQRLPKGDYVADFSKLLSEDFLSPSDGTLSASWSNPQFEGLFGNIDGFMDNQMIVGSQGLDTGIMTTRSLSSESMPSLASPDDFSTSGLPSPATLKSPSDHKLRQMASSEDCSSEHPLLQDPTDEDDEVAGTTTPELALSPLKHSNRKPFMQEKRPISFKSSLTASLKALRSAAQTVSNIATTPPLIQPDEFLGASVFDFKPELTDDRRPPPSNAPPSAAMRRYLNPRSMIQPDSPAQLHFWLDEKPVPGAPAKADGKQKSKAKKKHPNQPSGTPRTKPPRNRIAQLPPIVQLSTCIPSTVRTAHASSPPTWLDPDGTPSNKYRAAQILAWTNGGEGGKLECQPRPREPRDNRDFLRTYVCEANMRRCGKLKEEAVGHAKLWLPPVVDPKDEKGQKVERKIGAERWTVWSMDDL
ncbi:hypothetical protein B0A52_01325 [Exophiala mesophila]|uniref:Uncharacterized protein n=1 Tax=Exophiala mesophila TaxID=212818 RepID=A0A438NH45_EXOME|nr:hypothetical protein B0A52_01325 [Exophiala mesophila]